VLRRVKLHSPGSIIRNELKPFGDVADSLAMSSTIARDLATPAAGLLPCERRRGSRIPLRTPVRITYQGLRDEVSEDAICTDISETGIALETPADLYVGEIVDLEFRHPGADPVRVPVRLLYKIGNRYGAYFASPGSCPQRVKPDCMQRSRPALSGRQAGRSTGRYSKAPRFLESCYISIHQTPERW
jgi:PilZ domain